MKRFNELSKSIILDEIIENSHIENIEDVIFWALEAYSKSDGKTNGKIVAYTITQRILDAETEGFVNIVNHEIINTII